jgi:hypothetical protein
MAHFEVRQSEKLNLISYSGLALIGQCCQVDLVIDPKFPVSQGMRTALRLSDQVEPPQTEQGRLGGEG